MKKSQLTKDTSLSSSDIKYYEAKFQPHTTQTQFQNRKGGVEVNTFRLKKKSLCHDLNYSSSLNPFSRNKFMRYDQPTKDTYERKKRVPYISNAPTDPVTLRYANPEKQIRVRPQFENSFIYKKQVEKRCMLPADREYSQNKRQYFNQIGFSYSLEKLPRTRETQNSSKIRPVLQYTQADHRIEQITPKIGHFNNKRL